MFNDYQNNHNFKLKALKHHTPVTDNICLKLLFQGAFQ